MNMKQFIKSNASSGFYIVTLSNGTATALMWESSNAKWYEPRAYEGRAEVGYISWVCIQGVELEVIDVREIRRGSLTKEATV